MRTHRVFILSYRVRGHIAKFVGTFLGRRARPIRFSLTVMTHIRPRYTYDPHVTQTYEKGNNII